METRKNVQQLFVLSLLISICLVDQGAFSHAEEPSPPPLTKFGKARERIPEHLKEPQPTEILESFWPAYPEWLATFAEIMAGNPLTPSRGWYKKAIGQTRFDWKSIRSRFDVNGDRRISREEIPISEDDFDRLDLNHDGLLTAIDLGEMPDRNYLSRMGSEFSISTFGFVDRNHDGYADSVELAELLYRFAGDISFDQLFASIREELVYRSQNARQSLTLRDFQMAFELAARRGTLAPRPLGNFILDKIPAEKQMLSLLKQEIGAWGPGPALNDPAPNFRLPAADRTSYVSFSDFIGDKPLVLIFGNLTGYRFRDHAGSLETLTKRYIDRARFLFIYTRESSPGHGPMLPADPSASFKFPQPGDLDSRTQAAQICRGSLKLGIPMVVDTMDDCIGRLYSGMPSRMYLIDRHGKIAYKGGRGPFGFKPYELEQSLILLLQSEASPEAKSTRTTTLR